jgi:hypothetical protein
MSTTPLEHNHRNSYKFSSELSFCCDKLEQEKCNKSGRARITQELKFLLILGGFDKSIQITRNQTRWKDSSKVGQ